MTTRLPRGASKAASFTRLARSAPENPGVPRAMVLAQHRQPSAPCAYAPSGSFHGPDIGIRHRTCRSNGRDATVRDREHRGGWSPHQDDALVGLEPSISTSNWLSVCSRSSLPPPRPAPRWRPTASISSMKMMQGAFFLACSNMSRTRLAPTPRTSPRSQNPRW